MAGNIADLEAALASNYSTLESYYGDPGSNATKIAELLAKILTIKINLLKFVTENQSGDKYPLQQGVFLNENGGGYDQWQGVFVSADDIKKRNKVLDSYIASISPTPAQPSTPTSTLTSASTPMPVPTRSFTDRSGQQTPAVPSTPRSPVKEYKEWNEKWVQQPLGEPQWYNNHQVAMLTGRKVPVGKDGLSKFLESSLKNTPLTFSYLKVPNESDPSLNHFVSLQISLKNNKPEITYIDSNGEPMSPEDEEQIRAELKKKFKSEPEISYRDRNGEKLSQADARQFPHKMLRVQFDNHNCGMFSTEFTTMMREAKGNEDVIKAGIARIKENPPTPQERRGHHESHIANNLRLGQSYSLGLTQRSEQRGIKSKL